MIVLFRAGDPSPAMWKSAARTALVAGLLVAARPVPRFDREAVDPELLSCHDEIRQLARPAEGAALPTACIADGYWQGLRNFVAPTLYMSREFVSPDASALPASCHVAILRSDASVSVEPGFTKIRTCTIQGVEYNIYRREGYQVSKEGRAPQEHGPPSPDVVDASAGMLNCCWRCQRRTVSRAV